MSIVPAFLIFCLATMPLIGGCASTADLTRGTENTCEVHGLPMTVQVVKCHIGESRDHADDYVTMQSQFPHHGREQYAEDLGYIYAKKVKLYVCDACTKAYDQWQSERNTFKESLTP